jgi:lactoylglutathione lyase
MNTIWQLNTITLFTEDLAASKAFYQTVFDLTTVFEDDASVVFTFSNLMINILKISEAPELLNPAKVALFESGSRFMFTINVEDLDTTVADFITRGVTFLNGPINRSWGVRTASFADPGGHIWEIAQSIA